MSDFKEYQQDIMETALRKAREESRSKISVNNRQIDATKDKTIDITAINTKLDEILSLGRQLQSMSTDKEHASNISV